jgi:hypothetical protein
VPFESSQAVTKTARRRDAARSDEVTRSPRPRGRQAGRRDPNSAAESNRNDETNRLFPARDASRGARNTSARPGSLTLLAAAVDYGRAGGIANNRAPATGERRGPMPRVAVRVLGVKPGRECFSGGRALPKRRPHHATVAPCVDGVEAERLYAPYRARCASQGRDATRRASCLVLRVRRCAVRSAGRKA